MVSAAFATTASDYPVYVLGNATFNGGSYNGAVAVGGSASFSSTSLDGGGAGAPSLVVGQNLTYSSGGTILSSVNIPLAGVALGVLLFGARAFLLQHQ